MKRSSNTFQDTLPRHCFPRFLQTDGGLVPRLAQISSFESFRSSNRRINVLTDTDVVVK